MTLGTTNLALSAIQTEFGGSNPIALSEYYKGGAYVISNSTAPNGPIPTSGTISVGQFRGAAQGSLTPSYSFTPSVTTVNEGSNFTVTFATNQSGSFAYTITGVTSNDLNGASLTGTVSNGTVLTYTAKADITTEGDETFTITLNTIPSVTTSVSIVDTSVATYSLTRSVSSVSEGSTFTITFATNQSGSFGYTISGITSNDINGASLTGTVTNGTVLTYTAKADSLTEGNETFYIDLDNGLASTSVTIIDASFTPSGTYVDQYCTGYNLYYRYANGSGGTYSTLIETNSTSCGYVAPLPPITATWSEGYSNSGTPGPVSVFTRVDLSRVASTNSTFTWSGVVVENSVTFTVPSVTVAAGSITGTNNFFSGTTNGAGPSYANITFRVTPVSAPYPLTHALTGLTGYHDTTFRFSF